jgi:hypothetical protein
LQEKRISKKTLKEIFFWVFCNFCLRYLIDFFYDFFSNFLFYI